MPKLAQVKTFWNERLHDLEKMINKWLTENRGKIEVKSTSLSEIRTGYTAIVTYEVN